jgi:hypothetical protein
VAVTFLTLSLILLPFMAAAELAAMVAFLLMIPLGLIVPLLVSRLVAKRGRVLSPAR